MKAILDQRMRDDSKVHLSDLRFIDLIIERPQGLLNHEAGTGSRSWVLASPTPSAATLAAAHTRLR